jgi:hypothetical protein
MLLVNLKQYQIELSANSSLQWTSINIHDGDVSVVVEGCGILCNCRGYGRIEFLGPLSVIPMFIIRRVRWWVGISFLFYSGIQPPALLKPCRGERQETGESWLDVYSFRLQNENNGK